MLTCGFNQGQVILEGELQVAFLGPLADCLQQALPFEQPVEVNLSRVSGVDMAGLQLLMAFLQSRRQVGPVGLRDCPPVFLKALELAGLSEHFTVYLDQ